jgi:hypothetical protein
MEKMVHVLYMIKMMEKIKLTLSQDNSPPVLDTGRYQFLWLILNSWQKI